MVEYHCNRCLKVFNRKSTYSDHLKRKYQCKLKLTQNCSEMTQNCSETTQNCSEMTPTKKVKKVHKCNNCERIFVRKNNLARHNMNKVCYTKADLNMIEKLKDELEKIKKTNNNVLIKDTNITIKDNVNNNTHIINKDNVINNNVILVGYGKEDFSKIDKDKILKCLRSGGFNTAKNLTQVFHFDPEHPEHHNIYISNLKNKYAMMYEDNKWKAITKTELIDKIYEDKKNYVEDNLNVFYNSLTQSQKNSLKRWTDINNDDDKRIIKIKEEIKLLLFNKKDIPINTKIKNNNKKT